MIEPRFHVDGNYVRDRANGDRVCGPRMKRKTDIEFVEPTAEEAQAWADRANAINEEAIKRG